MKIAYDKVRFQSGFLQISINCIFRQYIHMYIQTQMIYSLISKKKKWLSRQAKKKTDVVNVDTIVAVQLDLLCTDKKIDTSINTAI